MKFTRFPFVAAIVIMLASCASQEARDTEDMLAAAGFQVKYAQTPEQIANLKELTQRKLVAHPEDGGARYVYADAAGCKCVYAGDEKAYQAYEKMVVKERVAEQQEMAAEMNEDAAMNWGAWGSWEPYPWY